MDIPDCSEMVPESHEWIHLIYGNIEELPLDMPIPLGKIVQKHDSSTQIFIMI